MFVRLILEKKSGFGCFFRFLWRWFFIHHSVRSNSQIRAKDVLVITEDGRNLGVMNLTAALEAAKREHLDLVEVSPTANPPVCKIMDFSKYKYELEQKNKKAKKHQIQIIIKEIKMRPKIDKHDYETKKKHVVRFLEAGNKVKATIMFRGREVTHPELGKKLLDRLAEDVAELSTIESPAKLDGRNMVMILASAICLKPQRSDQIAQNENPPGSSEEI